LPDALHEDGIQKKSQKQQTTMIAKQESSLLQIEKALLGATLREPYQTDDVLSLVDEDDFHCEKNRIIVRHIIEMNMAGQCLDILLLRQRLEDTGELDFVGGVAYISELMNVSGMANPIEYAKVLRENGVLKRLNLTASRLIGEANDLKGIVASLNRRVAEGHIDCTSFSNPCISIKEVGDEFMLNEAMDWIETGFAEFDILTQGGLQPGKVIHVIGSPRIGKTAFGLNIAKNAGMNNHATLVTACNKSPYELGKRMLRSCNFAPDKEAGRLSDEEKVLNSPIFFHQLTNRKISELIVLARRFVRQWNLRLMIVDETDVLATQPMQSIDVITRRLKALASELYIAICCLIRITPADCKPCGAVSQYHKICTERPDMLLMLHQESNEARKTADTPHYLTILEQSNGPSNKTVVLQWDKDCHTLRSDKKPIDDENVNVRDFLL